MGYESVIFDNDGVLLTLTDMDAHYVARAGPSRNSACRRRRQPTSRP
nr:hypothetical protein [Haloarcula sp. CBA1122]